MIGCRARRLGAVWRCRESLCCSFFGGSRGLLSGNWAVIIYKVFSYRVVESDRYAVSFGYF